MKRCNFATLSLNVDSQSIVLLWFHIICFCRLEDRASQSANSLGSNGALNADLLELNRRSSYSTFQHNESEMLHIQRSDFAYPLWKKPSVHREVEGREENSTEIWYGVHPGHTAADWGKATEECKKNKRLFAHRNNTSANLKTIPEDNKAENAKSGRRTIV